MKDDIRVDSKDTAASNDPRQLDDDQLLAFSEKLKQIHVEVKEPESIIQNLHSPNEYVEEGPFQVYLRHEEDVTSAYRDYYRDQVVRDKRNELGRFLFGVCVTTVGFIVGILRMSPSKSNFTTIDTICLVGSGTFLLLSSFFSLRLAVTKNQDVNPTTLELVSFHRANAVELSRLSLFWFLCWVIGLIFGLLVIFT